jgi:hypothetical protein
MVDIIVEIRIEDVLTGNPVCEESDEPGLDHHQNLDGAWSGGLYYAPRRTQSVIGLYAHDEESGSGRGFEKIVPLIGGPRERNVVE